MPREHLSYNSSTGDFTWIKEPNPHAGPRVVGTIAGGVNAIGYWQICFGRENFLGHRLAWLFTYGYYPERLDHVNGKRWDNRLCNLRECTHAQNIAAGWRNAKGYEVHGAKYRVRIVIDGIRHNVGSFDTLEEATAAYQTARVNLLGEFA